MSTFKKNKGSEIISGSKVEVKEDFSRALRLFSKKVQESGILQEIRERMEYEPQSKRKQRMKKQARKRWERQVESWIAEGQWHQDKKY